MRCFNVRRSTRTQRLNNLAQSAPRKALSMWFRKAVHEPGRCAHPQEAISTIDRSALSWPERHGSFNPTERTFDGNLDSLTRERLAAPAYSLR